jgi:hypothetical protein
MHPAILSRRRWERFATSGAKGGEEPLTFYRYPKSHWKRLRTTDPITRLIKEFQGRVKFQDSPHDADGAVPLLLALCDKECIAIRRIDGYRDLAIALPSRAGRPDRKAA